MLERKEPSVTIFRGDDTGGQLGKTIVINFHCGDTVNMEGVVVTFVLGGFYEKEFRDVHDGDKLEIFMTHEQTAMLPLGVSFGKLYGTDASGKIRTFSNRIPIRVTNHVCEAYGSAEESGIDVTISNAITWDSIFGKPDTFPPSEHRHQKSDIDDLENDLQTLSDGVESAIEAAEAAKTEAEKKYDKTGGAITGDVSISGSLSLTGSTSKITANQKDFSFPTESGKLARAEDYYTTAEVDDKITTFVAHYLTGKDSTGRFVPFATHAALDYAKQHHTKEDPQFFYAGEPFTPTKNDYCVVLADETVGGKTARYSFVGEWPTGSWQYQYTINDTAFSEAQWAAINSGVTSAWMESTLSALQAEVERAQAAEAQITTKAENAQSAANAAQSAANAASDKANELDAAKADKSALTAHVENTNNPHGVTAAQVGAVSISPYPTSDQTFDWSPSGVDGYIRLFGTYYKTGIGLGLWSGGGSLFNYHDDTSDIYQFPTGESGTLALTSDINSAVKNKLDKTAVVAPSASATAGQAADAKAVNDALTANIPYALTAKTISNGAVTLDDRSANAVTISTTLSPNTLTINFPTAPTGKVRDFALRLNIAAGVTAPEIAWPQGVTFENDGGKVPEIADGGTGGSSTILYFSETENNGTNAKFLVKGETLTAITQA